MKIGIIGGSGLDNSELLKDFKEIEVETKFGKPSSKLTIGEINNTEIVILARHGKGHILPPTQVNYRANIQALKDQNVNFILATTACGSLREEIGRGDFVILDQFIDFTRHRNVTFHDSFKDGIKHAPMAKPFDEKLRNLLIKVSKNLGFKTHERGTVITIEGPRFSTRAESRMFRSWGADVINMSVAPECILANEAGIPYVAIAMSTDYDSWLESEQEVTWEEVLKVFNNNAENVKKLLIETVKELGKEKFDLKKHIRTIPHWPKQGIMFRDITTLLKEPAAFNHVIETFAERYKTKKIDKVVGIESRGFIFGSALAHKLSLPFIPVRKPNKLPAETVSEEYELEYGKDKVEIHKDAINDGDKVLVADDLVASGGTALATCTLIKKLGGNVIECAFVIDLPDLGGKKKLTEAGYHVFNLIDFEGE